MTATLPLLDVYRSDDRHLRRIGYTALFLTFGLFGTWAALAPLDSAALAPGVVIVESHRKSIEHLEGGIVRELRVRDGDEVRAGDTLIVLDDTIAATEVDSLRSELAATEALATRLRAERDRLDVLRFEAQATADARSADARRNELAVFAARRAARAGELELLAGRESQLRGEIEGLQAMIASKRRLAASLDEEINDLRALLAEGFVDKQRLREQERSLYRLRAEMAEHAASISRAEAQIGETKLQALQLQHDFDREVATELATAQTHLFELRERLAAAHEQRQRTVIRAPESGRVLGLQVHTVGGVVRPAVPLLEIVPAESALVVEVQLSPIDIDRIALGTTADVRFSAFNSSTTPVIEGRLVHVSADRLVDRDTGMPYYLGRVELTPEGERRLGSLQLVPGMPAEVLINTGSRTLLDYLIQPATNLFARSLIEE